LRPANPIFDDPSIPSDKIIAGIGTLVFTFGNKEDIELPDSFYIPSAKMPSLCPQNWSKVTDTDIMWSFTPSGHTPGSSEPREESKEDGVPPPPEYLERLIRYEESCDCE